MTRTSLTPRLLLSQADRVVAIEAVELGTIGPDGVASRTTLTPVGDHRGTPGPETP
jgi:hypothetical protein